MDCALPVMSSPYKRLMDRYTSMVLRRLLVLHVVFLKIVKCADIEFSSAFHYVLIPMLNFQQQNLQIKTSKWNHHAINLLLSCC